MNSIKGITYTDGSKGTATLEQGKHGGEVLVLRKGFPVAAEVAGAVKVEQVTVPLLGALGVETASMGSIATLCGF
jgi:hypothetical protein